MRSNRKVLVRMLVAFGLVAAPAAIAAAPNQGNQSMVLKVESGLVSCEDPQPSAKVEGNLGETIEFSADEPIAFVTVKSGRDAEVVSFQFDTFSGTVTLSKDVSNYVVWTCPGDEESDDPS